MATDLNARIGRTLPGPAFAAAGQPVRCGSRLAQQRSNRKSIYVGALLVAGVLMLVGFHFRDRPLTHAAAAHLICQAESAR